MDRFLGTTPVRLPASVTPTSAAKVISSTRRRANPLQASRRKIIRMRQDDRPTLLWSSTAAYPTSARPTLAWHVEDEAVHKGGGGYCRLPIGICAIVVGKLEFHGLLVI